MTLNITLLNIGDTGYTFSNHDESIEKLKVIDVCKTDDGIYYYKCKDEICNFEIAAEKVFASHGDARYAREIEANEYANNIISNLNSKDELLGYIIKNLPERFYSEKVLKKQLQKKIKELL